MLYTVTLLLIITPGDLPEPIDASACEHQALKDVSHLLELYDRLGHWASDYRSELDGMRRRWVDSQGAPPIADSYRLPSERDCRARWDMGTAYVRVLEHSDPYRVELWLLPEARRCRDWWCRAAQAQVGFDLSHRRLVLAELRDALTPERWHVGDFPPVVPAVWQAGGPIPPLRPDAPPWEIHR